MGFDDDNLGSHAEYLCIGESRPITSIPENVSFAQAAASMEGPHYAINFMNKVPLAPGDSVLVYGATGAIGSAAVALLADAGTGYGSLRPRTPHSDPEPRRRARARLPGG